MSSPAIVAADGRVGAAAAAPMTVTQVMDSQPWGTGPPITSAAFPVGGNPLLVSAATSGWVGTAGLASSALTLSTGGASTPAGTQQAWMNDLSTHLAMLRSWALLRGIPASTGATVTAATGQSTQQDVNDVVNVTVTELGPGAPLAVRAVAGPVSAQGAGAGQPILYEPFVSFGGPVLIRAQGTAKASNNATLVSIAVEVDGQQVARTELLGATNAAHYATVPVDVLVDLPAGPHVVSMRTLPTCSTDLNDYCSVVVLEQTGPAGSIAIDPVLVNAPLMDQQGNGTAAYATFASGGGTLLIHASASAFAAAQNQIALTLELDGAPVVLNGTTAQLRQLANNANMHVTLSCADFVVSGVAAGPHTLTLAASATTSTNADDRGSLTVIELGPGAV
jgi:hypothetical protein